MNFIKSLDLIEAIFIFDTKIFKFGGLLGVGKLSKNTKFQPNI